MVRLIRVDFLHVTFAKDNEDVVVKKNSATSRLKGRAVVNKPATIRSYSSWTVAFLTKLSHSWVGQKFGMQPFEKQVEDYTHTFTDPVTKKIKTTVYHFNKNDIKHFKASKGFQEDVKESFEVESGANPPLATATDLTTWLSKWERAADKTATVALRSVGNAQEEIGSRQSAPAAIEEGAVAPDAVSHVNDGAQPVDLARKGLVFQAKQKALEIDSTKWIFPNMEKLLAAKRQHMSKLKDSELVDIYDNKADSIVHLQSLCKRYIAGGKISNDGRDSVNRWLLTDKKCIPFLSSPAFIDALFALEELAKRGVSCDGQSYDQRITVERPYTTITSMIAYGLTGNSPAALECLSLNSSNPNEDYLEVYLARKDIQGFRGIVLALGGEVLPRPPDSPEKYSIQQWPSYNANLLALIKQGINIHSVEKLLYNNMGAFPDSIKAAARSGLESLVMADTARHLNTFSLDELVKYICTTHQILFPALSHTMDRLHLLAALMDMEENIQLTDGMTSLSKIYKAVFDKLAAEPILEHAIAAEQFYVKLNMIVQNLPKAELSAEEIAKFQPSDPKQVARMTLYINDSAKMKEVLALLIKEDNVAAIRWLHEIFENEINWDEMLEKDGEHRTPLYIAMQNDSENAFDLLVKLGAKEVKRSKKGKEVHYSLLGYQLYQDSVLSCTGSLGLKAPEREYHENGSIDGQKSLEKSVKSLILAAGVGKADKYQKYVVQFLSENGNHSITINFPPRYGERFAVFLMENGLAEKQDWNEGNKTLTISPKNIERFLGFCQFPLEELQQSLMPSSASAVVKLRQL